MVDLCQFFQLPSIGVLLPSEQPYGSGDRCIPAELGQSSGLRLSPVCTHPSSRQQALHLQGDFVDTHSSFLALERMVSGPSESFCGSSGHPSFQGRPSWTAPLSSSAPEPPRASSLCVETLQRFACHLELSWGVARQLSLCRRHSSRHLYQRRWECYRSWCSSRGHSVSNPSISTIADFLFFLRTEKLFLCRH